MAPRASARLAEVESDTPVKTIRKNVAEPRATKPSRAKKPLRRWMQVPDREWFIETPIGKDKRHRRPHFYTVACRAGSWTCTCPDYMYREQRRHADCKHITQIKNSHRKPDAVHAYALSDTAAAQLKEYQRDKAAERRARRVKQTGMHVPPAEKPKPEPFPDKPPPPGLPKGCHERHERAVLKANQRMFEKMTVDEMKHQLREQDQLITGHRRELIERCADLRTYGLLPRCPQCGGGKLHVRYRLPVAHEGMGRFRCPGFYEEDHFHWCKYRSEREYRAPWIDQPPLDKHMNEEKHIAEQARE